MNIGEKVLSLCVIFVAGLVGCTGEQATNTVITVGGSSTIRPIIEAAAEAFKKEHPDAQFSIAGGGSSHGVTACGSGEVVIGMASRNLKESEKGQWKDLVPVKIGDDGIAIIVNKKRQVSQVTKEQIQDMYTGDITNWQELEDLDARIMLITKEEGRSTLELFLNYFSLEAKEVDEGGIPVMVHRKKGTQRYTTKFAKVIGANKRALETVRRSSFHIAYVSIGTALEFEKEQGRVKLLALDGVSATLNNVANGTYPLRRPLHIMTLGEPKGIVKDFIAFVTGREGQRIVAEQEFIPRRM